MREKSMCGVLSPGGVDSWEGRVWTNGQLDEYIKARPGRCVVLIDGYAIDVTNYLGEHVGLIFFLLFSSSLMPALIFPAGRGSLAS